MQVAPGRLDSESLVPAEGAQRSQNVGQEAPCEAHDGSKRVQEVPGGHPGGSVWIEGAPRRPRCGPEGGCVPEPQEIWSMLCTPGMHHRLQPSRNPGESGVYLVAFEKHTKTLRFSGVGGRGGLPFKSFKDI